mmetsp:Transcript_97893/g.277127  ORF Transcript_97893/g.277127 Transcript_97893/m.277127 type:complete len:213 (-) Transcript_97893:298-936(-)
MANVGDHLHLLDQRARHHLGGIAWAPERLHFLPHVALVQREAHLMQEAQVEVPLQGHALELLWLEVPEPTVGLGAHLPAHVGVVQSVTTTKLVALGRDIAPLSLIDANVHVGAKVVVQLLIELPAVIVAIHSEVSGKAEARQAVLARGKGKLVPSAAFHSLAGVDRLPVQALAAGGAALRLLWPRRPLRPQPHGRRDVEHRVQHRPGGRRRL